MYEIDSDKFDQMVVGSLVKNADKPKRKLFKLRCQRLEQIVKMTNVESQNAVRRAYDVFIKLGIPKRLKKLGAERGDYVKIANAFFEHRG